MRCTHCDEPHALTAAGSEKLTVDEGLACVEKLGARMAEVTGGEPLLQEVVPELVTRLCDAGCTVLIETGGHQLDPGADAKASG